MMRVDTKGTGRLVLRIVSKNTKQLIAWSLDEFMPFETSGRVVTSALSSNVCILCCCLRVWSEYVHRSHQMSINCFNHDYHSTRTHSNLSGIHLSMLNPSVGDIPSEE